jgi:hypothetical protein
LGESLFDEQVVTDWGGSWVAAVVVVERGVTDWDGSWVAAVVVVEQGVTDWDGSWVAVFDLEAFD